MSYALVIHGGAGSFTRENTSAEKEKLLCTELDYALQVGQRILQSGGTALDAATQTVISLENSPYFNAGKGAEFNHLGKNELDAAIMDGSTLQAGAVANVTTVKNPILLARAVMQKSEHVMLAGSGAEEFAREQKLELVDANYFFTQERYDLWLKEKAKEETPHSPKKWGTVGAVALDHHGNLAAATSTGGIRNKRYGRIGDSPLIGAGTYANNKTCAVSATGHGEYFIRATVAHDLSARIAYKNISLEQASHEVMQSVSTLGGQGGFIAVDRFGCISMPFNSGGMCRGYVKDDGARHVFVF